MERKSITTAKNNPSVLLYAGLSDSIHKSVETRARTVSIKVRFSKYTNLQECIQMNLMCFIISGMTKLRE